MTPVNPVAAGPFAALDPLLPVEPGASEGERLHARLPGGEEVSGVLYRSRFSGWESLWRATETWELRPLPGATGYDATAALLGALRARLRTARPPRDSACALTWPSRDSGATRALLDGGLTPYTVLGVREAVPVPPDAVAPTVTVRIATPADTDEAVGLWLAELRYSALVGSAVERDGAADWLAAELHRAVRAREGVWLAEADGVPVGLAVCGRPAPHPLLSEGRWGHVGTVSVASPARGTGVGRALVSVAHRELLAGGARGTHLFYSPHNALSSVFWHRQGYRPLWTTWEVRPAGALDRGPT